MSQPFYSGRERKGQRNSANSPKQKEAYLFTSNQINHKSLEGSLPWSLCVFWQKLMLECMNHRDASETQYNELSNGASLGL